MCVIDGWNFALSASVTSSSLFCRTPWPLARTRATNLGCPQPGRPRSGCALGPFVPHAVHGAESQPLRPRRAWARVFTTATPARFAVWLRMVGFSHAPMPCAAYYESVRATAVVRHARPAEHTLRVVVRSATSSRLSAHVRSIGQRGRQRRVASRHPATTVCGRRPTHGTASIPSSAASSRHGAATDPLGIKTSPAPPARRNRAPGSPPATLCRPRHPRT